MFLLYENIEKKLKLQMSVVHCIYKVHTLMYMCVQCTNKKWHGKFCDRNYAIETCNINLFKINIVRICKFGHLQIAVAVTIIKYMLVIRIVVQYTYVQYDGTHTYRKLPRIA
jgi:hypothetical protein